MTDVEPSLGRSREICRLGSALLECPECLLGLETCEWQKKLPTDVPKKVLHAFLDF